MKKKLLRTFMLAVTLLAGESVWATDHTWTFDTYCSNNNIAHTSSNDASGDLPQSTTTIISTSSSVDLTFTSASNNTVSKIYDPKTNGSVGGQSYSSYFYMGGNGSTSDRTLTTGTISGKGYLTIVYKDIHTTGSCDIYSGSTKLTSITPVASTAVVSSDINLKEGASLKIVHTGKVSIWAVKWTEVPTYTVTYKANGGTGDDVIDDDATTIAANAFTRSNYVFAGWNTSADGTGTSYVIGSAVSSSLTLYAQWKGFSEIISEDFEDAETYTNGWVVTNTTTSQLDLGDDGKKILFRTNKDKSQSTETYDFSSNLTGVTADYSFSFAYAFSPTGSSQIQGTNRTVLAVYAGDTELFHVTCEGSGGSGVDMPVVNASGTTIGTLKSQKRFTNPEASHFYTFTITADEANGTVLNITNNSGTAVNLSNSTLNASYLLATKIVSTPHNTSGQERFPSLAAFDNISFKAEIENLKSRASIAVDDYTAIKDEVMNSVVYGTLDGAHTALAAYSNDAAIIADGEGYFAAITALEDVIPTAQTSAEDFKKLNQLIENANSSAPVGYVAPEGATAVYTENADIDAATLITSVRAAIITAGTANDNTDITALIINNSFELGNTYGWTTIGSTDTGARGNDSPYTTAGIDGDWQFNTWSQGTPITQNIGSLPAGQYMLKCLTATGDGEDTAEKTGKVYLTMNDTHSDGVSSYNGAVYQENSFTFSLGATTEVIIGAVGSAADGSFLEAGHWWYKADKFTLTYLGEDLLEKAKTELNQEIEAATTVKNAWTPKVGSTPFKYAPTYYNVLVTELGEAAIVAESGSTVVDAYTTAKDELEAAKDNMSSSVQNEPDPDKYYRIFVANNDGSASAYNINMLKESTKTQVTVTATPYPVKIIASGTNYNIKTPYNNYLCTDKTNSTTAYVSSGEGVEARSSALTISMQDNGSFRISGTKSSTSYYYTASASEGSGVTAPTSIASAGTWVISEPVDITDVNLSVNATAGWGTFIAPYDNLTPSTVKAYTVSYTDNNRIYFEENTTGVLNANTPYVLSTEEAENVSVALKGIATNGETTSYEENGLVGLLAAQDVPADSYVLQYQAETDGTALYKLGSAMAGSVNRCYIDLSSVPTEASPARVFMSFPLFDNDVNAIKGIQSVSDTDDEVYNLKGLRVATPKSGLYIVNGKKVIIK